MQDINETMRKNAVWKIHDNHEKTRRNDFGVGEASKDFMRAFFAVKRWKKETRLRAYIQNARAGG